MRYFLPVACALAAALPARAALDDKLLPDDADAVIVVNVKQVLASDLYAKNFKKQVDDELAKSPAPAIFKELSLDPFKDVDRLLVVITAASGAATTPGGDMPLFLVEGRFDAAKLLAAAEKAAKDNPKMLQIHARGDAKIVEITGGWAAGGVFAAVVDKTHVAASPRRAEVEDALDKAAGKKKTALKNKTLAGLFARLKEGDSLSLAVSGDTATGRIVMTDGMKTTVTVTHPSDDGVQAFLASARADADLAFSAAVTGKDKDAADKLEKQLNDGLKQAIDATEKEKKPAVARALKTVKVSRKDNTLTIEGKLDADALKEVPFAPIAPSKPPPPPPPLDKSEKKDK
jgi:hypothetical protein